MLQNFVLLGDKTTHEGEVISASSTMVMQGKPFALIGEQVRCSLPGHGINRIVDGCSDWHEEGRAMAVDGCACECGGRVISSVCDCGVG